MIGGTGEHIVAFPVNSPLSVLAFNALVALTNNLGFIQSTEPCRHYDHIFCTVDIGTLNSRCSRTSHEINITSIFCPLTLH